MLVDVSVELRRHQRPVLGCLAGRHRRSIYDAGQFYFQLYRAVLVEVPEEPVLVIADRRDAGHHETPRAPHLGLAGTPVAVLPEDAVVFFMQANRVGDGHHTAAAVVHHSVEIVDLPQAVAAEGKGVGQRADAVLAGVEGVLAVVVLAGVTVGNDHVRKRGPVDDGPNSSLVVVTDVVDHQPFPGSETDAQAPLLPGDTVPVNLDASAFGLHDLQGFEVLSKLTHKFGSVIAGVGRQGNYSIVVHSDHFHTVEVNDGGNSFYRTGIAVVGGTRPEKATGQYQAASVLFLETIVTCRPRVYHYQVGVSDSSLFDGRLKFGAGLDGCFAVPELVKHDSGLHSGNVLPRGHLPLIKGYNGFVGGSSVVVQDDDKRLPLDRVPGPEFEHRLLRRFLENDSLEPYSGAQISLGFQDCRSFGDLFGCQRVQGMPCWSKGSCV